MRVIQLCESFSRQSETFIYDTVTELEYQGVDCHVITLNRTNEAERPFDKVHLAPWPGRWNLPRLWRRTLATVGLGEYETHKWPGLRARFRRHLERLRPDVVHAQFGPMGVLVAPVTEELDIPLVVTFHGYDISVLPRQENTRARYRVLFDKASLLIGVSSHNCAKLEALSAPTEKTRVLHNGTRLGRFTYSSPIDRFDSDVVRLLFVGRLVKVKSPLSLLDAFQRAKEKVGEQCKLHLTVAGDGPLSDSLRRRVEQYGLSNDVDCLGEVAHSRVQHLMQTHHIYAQHCKKTTEGAEEGLGVTFIEAQASGLPIVATRSGGIPDVVQDGGTGYLVPEGDTEAMADRIAHLVQHPEQWEVMGRAGRQHVKEHFDLTKQAAKLIRLYEEVCEAPVAPVPT